MPLHDAGIRELVALDQVPRAGERPPGLPGHPGVLGVQVEYLVDPGGGSVAAVAFSRGGRTLAIATIYRDRQSLEAELAMEQAIS